MLISQNKNVIFACTHPSMCKSFGVEMVTGMRLNQPTDELYIKPV